MVFGVDYKMQSEAGERWRHVGAFAGFADCDECELKKCRFPWGRNRLRSYLDGGISRPHGPSGPASHGKCVSPRVFARFSKDCELT